MNSIKLAFETAKIAPVDLAWFEHTMHRRFAPAPACVLRRQAKKAGFTSTVEYLAHEHKMRMEHKLHQGVER